MGPLEGIKIVELAGIGPAPMCAMLLADLGADVLRLDRMQPSGLGILTEPRYEVVHRSRPTLRIDLKNPAAVALVLRLAEADALIEGFRPGVVERLGVGPEPCLERNPRLIYGRVTGWGQTGPLAPWAGHDLNYIALTGALDAIGPAGEPPLPPLNLVGDYGGGALYLALGIVSGILAARQSGKGQVVDAAMIDGAASLMTPFFGLHAAGQFSPQRGRNILDGSAYFYSTYECADGKYVSIAAIEEKFFQDLLRRLRLNPADFADRDNPDNWPSGKAKLSTVFKTKTRDEWCRELEGSDACFAPVLSVAEAPKHAHHVARGTFTEIDGIVQPAPAPRFSGTPLRAPTAPPAAAADGALPLLRWGVTEAELAALRHEGAVG